MARLWHTGCFLIANNQYIDENKSMLALNIYEFKMHIAECRQQIYDRHRQPSINLAEISRRRQRVRRY